MKSWTGLFQMLVSSLITQHIRRAIIWLMEYILSGQPLSKVFLIQKIQRELSSNKCKKLRERTSNELLVCYNHGGQSSAGLLALVTKKKLKNIIYTCIILHNTIVEDEGETITNWVDDVQEATVPITQGCDESFQAYMQQNVELRDREMHHHLRADLVEHIWNS